MREEAEGLHEMIFAMTNKFKSINKRHDEDRKELKNFRKEYDIDREEWKKWRKSQRR